ncbi:MAG TPA: hypothetical protein VH724_11805, partial [Candidatus Angelobacter sp.]|nr:hypothetical protein [Candidatus Angelobacter sp.]
NEVGDKGIVEFRPRMEGNTVHVILAPPKQVPGGKKPENAAGQGASKKPESKPAPQPQQAATVGDTKTGS